MVREDTLAVDGRQEPRLFFKRLSWYRRRVESLEEQAVLDHLTGLRNQRALWRELHRRTATCSESSPLALVMLDFDLFKEVNERYGHAVGDAVLRRGASILRAAAPSPRLAFRYGGEEFVLLLPGDEADGEALAERVRAEIASQNGALPAITVSCGVAELDSPVEPWVALDRADAALRDAKRAGRNRVVVASRMDLDASPYPDDLEHEPARRAALALAVATLEVRDRDTAEHSDDVLTLCESIGRKLGFDGRRLERLMAGAQLHDVGKVAVPSEILSKPGPLDDHEWAVMREHTVIGERILRSVPEMAEVATIVRHSHEHWDGGGYPDGLAREQIPLASRVILCADAFHAIRSDRPYRAGRPARDALDEVRAAAGRQFDPRVVAALVAVADDLRGHRSKPAGVSLAGNRRLIALLATLAIGSGSALAASPDLRDAVRSVFGIATAEPGEPRSGELERGFDFGPLGDRLSLDPDASRRTGLGGREPRAGRGPAAGGLDTREAGDSPASARDTAPSSGKAPARGGRDEAGGGGQKPTPRDAPAAANPDSEPRSSAPADTGPSLPQSGGSAPAPQGQGPIAAPVPAPVPVPLPDDDYRDGGDHNDDHGGGRGRDDDHEGRGHDKHHGDGNKHQGHTGDAR